MPESLPARRPSAFADTGSALSTVLMAVVVVAALYFGREVLVPIALAVLLSFVLAPLVRLLQRLYLPRIVAVAIVVLIAFAAIFALGSLMVSQVNQLASDLPQYQSTLREKIHSLRAAAAATGTLERASEVLQDLSSELDKPNRGTTPPLIGTSTTIPKPIPVEVRQPDPGALQTLVALITPLIHPLATTGIVVIFVIFILMQMQDLRNRLVRLAGSQDLQRTTAAIDDAGQRLSRLFLTQFALNAGFGVVIGAGLWLIGVPSAPLWGMLAMVLRFVPYIGAAICRNSSAHSRCCGRTGLDAGAVDRRAVPIGGAGGRAHSRAAAVRARHRALAGRGHGVGDVLDLALGTDRPGPGHAPDDLPGGARSIRGSP